MRRSEVPVENVAEIVYGTLLVVYLIGAGRPDFLRPLVLAVFGLSAGAAFLELYLRRIKWRWLHTYDSVVWTILLSAMVIVTGGRGSEVWPAYMLMSLTAPSMAIPSLPYVLLGVNSLLYVGIYTFINPYGAPFTWSLLLLRVGLFFLITYVVDRSMERERAANLNAMQVIQNRVTELVSARDAERKRIAGDIHDWLGTGIVAPMRKLELALRANDMDGTRTRVNEALDILRRSHEELRRLMENLHPHLLEQMGLAEALRAYLQKWGDEQETVTAFHPEDGPEPPADLALATFRILQEALNNCHKHAEAGRVTVRLILTSEYVQVAVTDDGRGFAAPRQGGRGLTGMSERASAFGGTVTVTSRPGQGTTVFANLPVRKT